MLLKMEIQNVVVHLVIVVNTVKLKVTYSLDDSLWNQCNISMPDFGVKISKWILYGKVAREGERCSGRMKCADGLRCVGKILEVDGQGTCRKSGNLLNLIALLSILAQKSCQISYCHHVKLNLLIRQ